MASRMIAKAKNCCEIVKTSVSLSSTGCLSGCPGRREHSFKISPSDNVDHKAGSALRTTAHTR